MIATNAFKQAVVGTYTTSDTVIELDSISDTVGNADYLPNGGFNLILYDGLFGNPADANNAGDYEILACTGVNYATNEITVVRAQENTAAVTIGAGSWQVVYGATKAFFDQFEGADATILKEADIVNDLTTGGVEAPLSAEQGKELKTQLDAKGKVVQVVHASNSTTKLISSESLVDTNLTATITPKKTGNKIWVVVNQAWGSSVTTENPRTYTLAVIRGSTNIAQKDTSNYGALIAAGFSEGSLGGGMDIVDAPTIPETPVPITYKTQSKVNNETDAISVMQPNSSRSSMTLIEIEPS